MINIAIPVWIITFLLGLITGWASLFLLGLILRRNANLTSTARLKADTQKVVDNISWTDLKFPTEENQKSP